MSPSPSWRRVVLLGMMGSGKSTVGALLAARLGWESVDLDREIEAEAGATVAEIFAREGESGFRAREADAARRVLGRDRVVVATGGGWAANPAASRLPEGTLTVWLRAPVGELVRRLGAEGVAARPLLQGGDPAVAIASLLRLREPHYARAAVLIDTDERDPERVVTELAVLLAAPAAPEPS